MRIFVTGASGFIGAYLVRALLSGGHEVRASSRSRVDLPGIFYVAAPELGPKADWLEALHGVDSVVHLAGRAHVLNERPDPKVDELYDRINTAGTMRLAQEAQNSGVRHFVFVSSIGAMAESSDEMLSGKTPCCPVTPYGKSKLEAEKALRGVAEVGGMAWTIIRPPLVYGLGNPGNMDRLLKLVKTGLPLPLASVRNRRSFIYVENLVDLIATCLGNPKAFGKTFLPSDGEDVSTPELIRAIAHASASVEEDRRGKIGDGSATRNPSPATRHSPRLFPFPESILKAAGRLPGLGALRKLTSSLYVDSEPIRRELGWTPPFTMEEGLRRTLVIDYAQFD